MKTGTKLCGRCEHRAQYYETGYAPRFECGDTSRAVGCCYMFKPADAMLVTRARGDRRAIGAAPIIAARVVAAGTAGLEARAAQVSRRRTMIYRAAP